MMEVKELYTYDETSPTCLRWKVDIFSGRNNNKKNVSAGDVAGGMSNSGYYQVRKEGSLQLVSRIVWEIHYGKIRDGFFIDHKDQCKTNNKIDNLREVERSTNARNYPQRVDNTSGQVGVTFLKNKQRSGNYAYLWRAFWCELDGRKASKSFNIAKYGYEEAYKLACEYREQQIERLNNEGANYSNLHGK